MKPNQSKPNLIFTQQNGFKFSYQIRIILKVIFVRVLCMGQIDLFENYSYLIGLQPPHNKNHS